MQSELTSDERKELRNRHPLYRRMSGDVIWELLKEGGYDDESCGNYMDVIIADMHKTVAVMHALEKDPTLYLGFVGAQFVIRTHCDTGEMPTVGTRIFTGAQSATASQLACKECANLMGKVIAVKNIHWHDMFPPFAVGCQLQPKVFTAKEVEQLVAKGEIEVVTKVHTLHVPKYMLLCEQFGKE